MKVAIVHDYIKEYGGAERVLEALHDIYPKADVYTSVYLPSYLGPHRDRFNPPAGGWKIHTSFLQWIPFKAKLISPLRLLSPLAFKQFDFSSYDVIISSASGAYFPNMINKKSAKLYCYCHTPPRYLYGYATAREWKNNKALRVVGEVINHFLRIVDFDASKNVDQYIANSEEVRGRIQKFYRKNAVVIYPPVSLANGKWQMANGKSGDYYLTGGRLARAKHVDIIVKACSELKIQLKVFGKGFGGYGEELREMANGSSYSSSEERSSQSTSSPRTINNIEFVGEVNDEEKLALMKGAKAFLFASEDEDFGITPVEAMGQGLPVIAYNSGGVKETVVEGKTGMFFKELTVESLKKTIKEFEKKKWTKEESVKRAKEFSEDVFKKKISSLVKSS
ncbi:MAG: glycosyltransferase [Candidatus Levybacteria bacterium]|nr:glycosyltransferase [Candidatus Levybacteria bacterium]